MAVEKFIGLCNILSFVPDVSIWMTSLYSRINVKPKSIIAQLVGAKPNTDGSVQIVPEKVALQVAKLREATKRALQLEN